MLKRYYGLSEAAEFLSADHGESVTVNDVLDIACRRELTVCLYFNGLVCGVRFSDSDDLIPSCVPSQITYDSSGIYQQIYQANRDSRHKIEGAWTIAGFLLVVSCIPYVWYFFLRRLREIAKAVTGRDN
jgi:hypothetical protein